MAATRRFIFQSFRGRCCRHFHSAGAKYRWQGNETTGPSMLRNLTLYQLCCIQRTCFAGLKSSCRQLLGRQHWLAHCGSFTSWTVVANHLDQIQSGTIIIECLEVLDCQGGILNERIRDFSSSAGACMSSGLCTMIYLACWIALVNWGQRKLPAWPLATWILRMELIHIVISLWWEHKQ